MTHTEIEKSVKLAPPVKSIRSLNPSRLTPLREVPAPQLGVGMNVFVEVGVIVGVIVVVVVGVVVGEPVGELVAVTIGVAVAASVDVIVAVAIGVAVCASELSGIANTLKTKHSSMRGRAQTS